MKNTLAERVVHIVRNDESMRSLLHSLHRGIILIDKQQSVIFVNHLARKAVFGVSAVADRQRLELTLGSEIYARIEAVLQQGVGFCFLPLSLESGQYTVSMGPIDAAQEIVGAILLVEHSNSLECFADLFQSYATISKKIKSLAKIIDDEYFITDEKGNVIDASPGVEMLYDIGPGNSIGENVFALRDKGTFYPSVTERVFNEKKKVSLLQNTGSGKILLVSGSPVIDKAGVIFRVVVIVKDVSRLYKMESELFDVKQELELLRQMQTSSPGRIVFKSSQMNKVMSLAERAARVDSNVLILGESGVGKGILADTIHTLSSRCAKHFVSVNCGAIPETLMEAELFGYARGAFTGANKAGKVGLIEEAHGGTLFLDEVSELPLNMQVKLLKVLGEKRFMRVGSSKIIESDFRIIAATNGDLATLVQEGKFREDLYYRLNVIPIYIPPLRKRKEDTLLLINYFLHKNNQKYGWRKKISPGAIDLLTAYNWPGNVRELENGIERLVVTIDRDLIDIEDLPTCLIKFSQKLMYINPVHSLPLQQTLEQTERQLILSAYQEYKNTYKVASQLKISQSTVVRKLKKYGIGHEKLIHESTVNS